MNRLEKTVSKLSKYPKRVLSFAIGRVVPYVGHSGVYFEEMTKEKVRVRLMNKRKTRNHIKQIHAAAMFLLAETATGMVLGMNIPDDKIPLIKSMDVKFVKRSTGAMKAEAYLQANQLDSIKTDDKGEVKIPVKVWDEKNVEPIICEVVWAWIPKNKKKAI